MSEQRLSAIIFAGIMSPVNVTESLENNMTCAVSVGDVLGNAVVGVVGAIEGDTNGGVGEDVGDFDGEFDGDEDGVTLGNEVVLGANVVTKQ